MAFNGFTYGYFLNRNAESFHQLDRIALRLVRSAEARHCHADYAAQIFSERFERADGYEQRERGIKPARNAYYRRFRARVRKPFFKSFGLNGKNKFASFRQPLFGNKRKLRVFTRWRTIIGR